MKKIVPYLFFILLSFLLLWFLGAFLVSFYSYQKFNEKTEAQVSKWEVGERKDGSYYIKAYYDYSIDQKKYSGETLFKEKFLNILVAKKALAALSKNSFTAWYNDQDRTSSSIERKFPVKEGINSLIVLAVFLYFVLLNIKMRKKLS